MREWIGKHFGKDVELELAPHSAIDALGELPYEFLYKVFKIKAALITDQSSLWDFEKERPAVIYGIKLLYGVDVSDIDSGNLVEVLHRIKAQN